MPDNVKREKVICQGGLISNENHLDLSDNEPGSATRLINYEPSLFGGYRRIEGYAAYEENYPEVNDSNNSAEGKVLCVAMYRNEELGNPFVIAARKDTGTNTYSFWRNIPLVGWDKMTTGFTRSMVIGSRSVTKLRFVQSEFGGKSVIIFVDGVNPAIAFDGIDWREILTTGAGTEASPGGDQAIARPAIVDVFKDHLFLGGDRGSLSTFAYSAPSDYLNWTSAGGAGQISAGLNVVQIKPFRDNLFVFGANGIKKVSTDSDPNVPFTIEPVTANVGCIARDSVMEIGGDLVFLAPDGLRPVAGTSRIGDVEIETISKPVQGRILELIEDYDLDTLNAVVIRSKSQVRYFFGDDTGNIEDNEGLLAGLTDVGGSIQWTYSDLQGIRASCTTSEYVGRAEFVLHGDYDGKVYRQEQGSSFNGTDIVAVYSTPYLDFGDTGSKKVLHSINTFLRAEGPLTLGLSLSYDWGDPNVARPLSNVQTSFGVPVVFGGRNIAYGSDDVVYGGASKPVMVSRVQGSGYSVRVTYVSVGQDAPYSIQGLVIAYQEGGQR